MHFFLSANPPYEIGPGARLGHAHTPSFDTTIYVGLVLAGLAITPRYTLRRPNFYLIGRNSGVLIRYGTTKNPVAPTYCIC